jgi:hypothetical protein
VEKRGRVTRQTMTADKNSRKGKSARARSLSIGAGNRGIDEFDELTARIEIGSRIPQVVVYCAENAVRMPAHNVAGVHEGAAASRWTHGRVRLAVSNLT